jgi:hypothetical protein
LIIIFEVKFENIFDYWPGGIKSSVNRLKKRNGRFSEVLCVKNTLGPECIKCSVDRVEKEMYNQ